MKTHQLRYALGRHLGQVISPEVAARIEAMAETNAMPVPRIEGGPAHASAEQRREFYAFLDDGLEVPTSPNTSRVLASVWPDGSPRAVVAYWEENSWSAGMGVVTDRAPRWLTRRFLRQVFAYPFLQLRKRRVTVRISERNAKSLALCRGLGFKDEGRRRLDFGDHDAVLMGMLKTECPWIGGTDDFHA